VNNEVRADLQKITRQARTFDALCEKIGQGNYEKGKEKIESRAEHLHTIIERFLITYGYTSAQVLLNQKMLESMILDYFADVARLKDFHDNKYINKVKIHAYIAYWFLRRKPLQALLEDEALVYVNEEFVYFYLVQLLPDEGKPSPHTVKETEFFFHTLWYHLRYRKCDAQALELMLLAFEAGQQYEKAL
jgi:hypothetical protein